MQGDFQQQTVTQFYVIGLGLLLANNVHSILHMPLAANSPPFFNFD